MDNYYSMYPGYPGQPYADIRPNKYEKRRIKRVYSGAAWVLIASELVTLIFALIITGIYEANGIDPAATNEEGQYLNTVSFMFYGYMSVTFSNILIILLSSIIFKKNLTDLFRDTSKLTPGRLTLTALIALGTAQVVYFLDSLIYLGLDSIGYMVDVPDVTDPMSGGAVVMDVLTTVVFAPIFEELLYRGIIMRRLCRVSRNFAIFTSALIFGLIHGNIYQFILGFAAGVVFAYADIRMNSIIPSIIAHMAINGHSYIYELFGGLPENQQEMIQSFGMGMFFIAGVIALVIAGVKYGIKFPEYDEYHKKRTLPILVASVPAWVCMCYFIFSIAITFVPVK
ncbi:MAG: CPBP family intramembrane metalloprotease [Oscillospiraceae bacterium]|nr:CPBP family intramembrane metalloprotease [Oscillospiraceae bacterium]